MRKMKHMKRLTLVLAMTLLMTGCGSKSDDKESGTSAKQTQAESGTAASTEAATEKKEAADDTYYFQKDDVKISMGAPADDVIAQLGAYKETYEAPSCAFDGMDVIYTYPGYEVLSYKKDGSAIISGVVLRDDTYGTVEGVYIGSDRKTVEGAYGKTDESSNSLKVSKGNCDLLIIFEKDEDSDASNDKVNSIQYTIKE